MDIIETIILGLTQGLTEFIPVSSSGHLVLIENLLGGNQEGFHLFLELINFGTLLALLIYYRKRIWGIIKDVFVNKNYRLFINILLTSIPAGLIGMLLSDFIEETPFFASVFTVAAAMGIVGVVMVIVDKLPHLSKLPDENALTHPRALTIGLAQAFALIPGVSRSGSTIITGKLMGMDARAATDYSFLASIPIMLGVCLKSLVSSTSRAYMVANAGPLILSNLVAFVSGLLALALVLRYVKKSQSIRAFGYYRIILSCCVLIYLLLL